MKALYVLDAVSLLFRAYYAIGNMTNVSGQSTNALYGFIRSVQKILQAFSPTHLVAVFDGPNNKASRTKIYPKYKGHRAGMPEDLVYQLKWATGYCEMAGITVLQQPNVEADDVIGSIATLMREKMHIYICSSDKDLCQLISPKVTMLNVNKNNQLLTPEQVKKVYGVHPDQIADYLAITGDVSDNIPGIPGFGPKTAAKLLNDFHSLQSLYDNIDKVASAKQKAKLQEHKEMAFISLELAKLDLTLNVPKEAQRYAIRSLDQEKLRQLYTKMGFLSLLKDMDSTETPKENLKQNYTLVDSEQALLTLLDLLKEEKEICIDTETTAIHPIDAQLVGIGLTAWPGEGWYIPLNGSLKPEWVLATLKPFLEDPKVSFYGHNIKYDLHILRNYNIDLSHICFDTQIASYLVDPHLNKHNLNDLSLEYFQYTKIPIEQLIGKGEKQKSMFDVALQEITNYCCEDVDMTCRLKSVMEKKLEDRDLLSIFTKIELPLIPVLAAMEREGIYVDKALLQTLSKHLKYALEKLEKEIYALAQRTFNIKSPKQLNEVLFDHLRLSVPTKKKSTRADVLKALQSQHPIAKALLEFRALEKLRSTYVDTLPKQISPKTGKIHCNFNQAVTATGRLSSQDPNLQNIPIRSQEGKAIRKAFKVKEESLSFLSADYSQIELRLLAHFSQDEVLVSAFKNNEDIHAKTAADIFDVPLSEVTKKMRLHAKTVNFGIIYGQQAFGLSQELGCDLKTAKQFIEKYFHAFPKVKTYLESSIDEARNLGYATTLCGRKRPLPQLHSKNAFIRSSAERLAVNTPLQGSQADIIKLAMIQIHENLQENQHMLLQIHDELIFECPDSGIKSMQKMVKTQMENIIPLNVPLVVNLTVGKNWSEC